MTRQFDQIAEFVANPQVPDSALHMASTLLIDTLGVAAGATDLDAGRIARDHAARFQAAADPDDAVPILFDGRRASIPGAAFAAATQIDNLDGHDGYNPTKGHIGCAVAPALMAFAQRRPEMTGPAALSILAMSYEIAARAALSLHATVTDYHTSGAWNALAVAALGCRMMDADTATLRQALGIAEYHGPRSQMMREIANPTMLHDGSGMGALIGAMAALMAQDGFQGAPAITVESPEVAPYWADLGQLWTVELNYIKPYPICRWAHAAIDALSLTMQRHALSRNDITHITVRTFAESAQLFPGMPKTTSQAQYSLPFALAVMWRNGKVGPDHISGAALQDPDIAALLPHITVLEEPRHSRRFPVGRWSDLTLNLRDGRQLHSGDVHACGGPEHPMKDAEVQNKFLNMMPEQMPKHRADAIWAMRDRLLDPTTPFAALNDLVSTPIAPET